MKETVATKSDPSTTLSDIIGAFQAEHDISDDKMAASLGFAKGNVITLIKRGSMAVPLDKIKLLADVTGHDPAQLFDAALEERDPALLEVFRSMVQSINLTPAERRLIHYCRNLAGDREVSPMVIDGRSVVALLVR